MNRASSPGADTVPPLRGLLDLLARGDLAAAAVRHASIRRTLLSPMAERRLHRLIDGERPVALHEGTYYVGRADTAQTGVVRTALEFLSSRGASVSRCVVVEFAGDPSQVAAALALDADTVYLCLSGGDADDLVAAAIHEFAHVAFESGNRFLDEGAAHYFESEYRERSLADTEAAPAPAAPAIDARTLLAYEAHDDPYFDLILPGNGLRVHGIGAMFFARLLARLPLPAVQALYRRIREQGAEANGALSIEQTCGISIEEIESGSAAAARTLARAPVIGAAQVAEVESALVAGDLPELTRHYEQLFAHVSTAAAPIARVAPIEALVLASVAMHKSFERVVTRYELAFVRGRLLSHLARPSSTVARASH